MDFDFEAFSHNPTDDSFTGVVYQPTVFPVIQTNGSLLYEVGLLSWQQLQQWGKTNLSHDGLNPAHLPFLWVKNSTLGVCNTKIGKADMEESKSNVPMDAWPPQTSYPCLKHA